MIAANTASAAAASSGEARRAGDQHAGDRADQPRKHPGQALRVVDVDAERGRGDRVAAPWRASAMPVFE